ncbi:MAG: ATP-binding cassette domain-containing protein, partial [Lachnospiraceae bacterium]|nr:ATP-binding cassette domain-containing protein [Lachnospiraceae bacterium]
LLYALSGMDRPTLGTVTYFVDDKGRKMGRKASSDEGASGAGIEISKFSNDRLALFRRDHAGFVFQQNHLNDSMSALDNVMISGLLKSNDRKALAAKAKELLGRVEITENDYRKFPTQLSGGQQQRVAVVRGVINDPEILFADEPTGALNSQNTTNVLDILSDLNRQGQSIVMVTHTIKAAERGNRIIYLTDGVIADECDLGEYAGDYRDEANPTRERAIERHRMLKDFLQGQGW